jgi:hypothetical protein
VVVFGTKGRVSRDQRHRTPSQFADDGNDT